MATAGMGAGISTVMWSSPITTQAPERGLSPSMTHLQSIPHRPPTQLPLGQGINIFLTFIDKTFSFSLLRIQLRQ